MTKKTLRGPDELIDLGVQILNKELEHLDGIAEERGLDDEESKRLERCMLALSRIQRRNRDDLSQLSDEALLEIVRPLVKDESHG